MAILLLVVRNLAQQSFQAGLGALYFVLHALGIVFCRYQLLPQLLILAFQALAQLEELVDFAVECVEFRIHHRTIVSKILISQVITGNCQCSFHDELATLFA